MFKTNDDEIEIFGWTFDKPEEDIMLYVCAGLAVACLCSCLMAFRLYCVNRYAGNELRDEERKTKNMEEDMEAAYSNPFPDRHVSRDSEFERGRAISTTYDADIFGGSRLRGISTDGKRIDEDEEMVPVMKVPDKLLEFDSNDEEAIAAEIEKALLNLEELERNMPSAGNKRQFAQWQNLYDALMEKIARMEASLDENRLSNLPRISSGRMKLQSSSRRLSTKWANTSGEFHGKRDASGVHHDEIEFTTFSNRNEGSYQIE